MSRLGKIVYLSEAQLQTLFVNGSVTVEGVTINYSDSDIYVTPASPTSEVSVITPESGSTFNLSPCPATYNFGECAELTVTVTPRSQYHFMFTCPSSAATVLTINGITGTTGDTTLEAGATYEVDVWAGIALYRKVEVTVST